MQKLDIGDKIASFSYGSYSWFIGDYYRVFEVVSVVDKDAVKVVCLNDSLCCYFNEFTVMSEPIQIKADNYFYQFLGESVWLTGVFFDEKIQKKVKQFEKWVNFKEQLKNLGEWTEDWDGEMDAPPKLFSWQK
jgi:hypothetical protein